MTWVLLFLVAIPLGVVVGELGYRIGNWTYDRWPDQINWIMDL